MKKNILILITLFCTGNFVIAKDTNQAIDPPGMFGEANCTEIAFELYDELVNQEIDRETASQTAFMTLIECESQN